MTVNYPYLEIIASEFPNVVVSSPGLGFVYQDLILEHGGPIPTEAELQSAYMVMMKRKRNEEINHQRDLRKNVGFWWEGNIYDCDDLAKSNVTGAVTAVLAGGVLPANFSWRTKVNTNVPMVVQDVKDFGLAMMNYIATVFQWSWNLKNALMGYSDIEDVLNFDATLGWPSNNWDGSGPGPSTMQSIGMMVVGNNYQMDFGPE